MSAPDDTVGYSEIAEILGFAHASNVRKLASRDAGFPQRVTPPESRTPLFARAAVEEYAERRRSARTVGRPPAVSSGSVAGDPFASTSDRAAFGDTVRDALGAGAGGVRTTSELADVLGLSIEALRFRLRGSVRWTTEQLAVVERVLGVSPTR